MGRKPNAGALVKPREAVQARLSEVEAAETVEEGKVSN